MRGKNMFLYTGNAFILTLIVELLCRKSLWKVLGFMAGSPFVFLFNALIILLTLCLSGEFGKRRYFAQACVNIFWLLLGIVNAIVLKYRMTPFSAEDLNLIPMLSKIARNYLTVQAVAALGLGMILLIALMVFLWMYLPKDKHHQSRLRLLTRPAAVFFCLYLVMQMGGRTQAISQDFQNLAQAYENYGFAYCFSNSLVDIGIGRPDAYSRETMEEIAGNLDFTQEAEASVHPDIIMIQLESFFDPTYLNGFSFSADPAPFFRSLKESCPSGHFEVPVVGAGTANTEFEVLTGMSTEFFGTGEYPYNTVLQKTTSESLPNLLRPQGYESTVIHNNTGTFYKRNTVFSSLGFDRFVPAEYMYDLEYTPTNWAKDSVLTGEILRALDTSEGPDFIYTITVQSHGRYPEHPVLENPQITVTAEDPAVNPYPLEYYANQVHDVDCMIRDLVEALDEREEPAVLVLYGDHLPALGFAQEDLDGIGLYETEYVIWNNAGLEFEGGEAVSADAIGSRILRQAGLQGGIMSAFRSAYDAETEEGKEALQLIEYDLLYGDQYLYELCGEKSALTGPYEPSELAFGTLPILAESAESDGDSLIVHGQNFNESSRVVIDGEVKDTVLVDRSTLRVEEAAEPGSEIRTAQCDDNQVILGEPSDPVR